MAKVQPSNLFLKPLDLFCYLENQTIFVSPFKQNVYLILHNKHKSQLLLKGSAPEEKWISNLALKQKSLAPPEIYQ